MTPGTYNISTYRGATLGPIVFTFNDANEDPINLTGYSVSAQVRVVPGGALLLNLAPSITDATAGEVTIELTDEQMTNIISGSFVWDLFLTDGTGARRGPYVAGTFIISEPVTQA